MSRALAVSIGLVLFCALAIIAIQTDPLIELSKMNSLHRRTGTAVIAAALLLCSSQAFSGFMPLRSSRHPLSPVIRLSLSSSSEVVNGQPAESSVYSSQSKLSTVAVAGATGKTGSLVVRELRSRGINVVALVRDLDKAEQVLDSSGSGSLTIKKCDHSSPGALRAAMLESDGGPCDAAIWAATGFSDAPSPERKREKFMNKLIKTFGKEVPPKPRQSIDAIGVKAMADAILARDQLDAAANAEGASSPTSTGTPRVVMLSSAGVTRPSWSKEKQGRFEGAAGIPIIRLNPFNILGIKADSEERLRQSGVDYCIFRPCGLSEKWPYGGDARPIFSQGDLAVGRIHRCDVAKILVDCLFAEEATGKTFEAVSLAGYPPAPSMTAAMERLRLDSEGPVPEDALMATYSLMQQCLPGETQDSAALAMGQTYEQLDKGETGRLGKKGEEKIDAATPRPTVG